MRRGLSTTDRGGRLGASRGRGPVCLTPAALEGSLPPCRRERDRTRSVRPVEPLHPARVPVGLGRAPRCAPLELRLRGPSLAAPRRAAPLRRWDRRVRAHAAIATLAACGVEALARRAPRRARGLALGALGAVAASGPLARSIALDRLLAREDTRLAASRWIVSHIPSGETIMIVFPGWFSMPSLPRSKPHRVARPGGDRQTRCRSPR